VKRAKPGPTVRELAAGIARGVIEGRGAARTHLERAFAREMKEARERAFLTELVYGTIRHRATLDHLIESRATREIEKIQPEALAHIRVAAYQLLFLDNVPPAVAVNEAVERARAPALKGFVNGVLRALAALVEARTDDASAPWSRRIPGRERGWVVLREPVLPDAERRPAEWLALATAHPDRLARRWIARFGLERALEVCRANNAPPPVVLRANLLRGTRDELAAMMMKEGVETRPGVRPEALVASHTGDLTRLASFQQGLFTVQDETAMGVAPFLDPRPGERVLDLCAAPGGKATHAAELMRDAGIVVATDVEGGRLDRVRANAARLGLSCVVTFEVESAAPVVPGARFERVLCDVPCSNTGVLRRRVEARERLADIDTAPLVRRQKEIAATAAERTAPGGVLVYSTCSIEEEENEAVAKDLVARFPDFTLEEERLSLPSPAGGDGGYVARLRRR
jgi:16S rRNA (cytosine967-C5)-methyltransferase